MTALLTKLLLDLPMIGHTVTSHQTIEPDLVVTGNILIEGRPTPGAVSIKGGSIVSVDHGSIPHSSARHLDVGNDLIMPGVVDAHVHSYSHSGEGLRASTSAAAAGGVTTIVEMPFDGIGPVANRDRLFAKQDLVAEAAVVDVALLGTLLPGGGWRAAEDLVEGGVVGFKGSLFDTDPFRFPRTSDAELIDVMRTVREVGSTLCVHAENNEIIKARLADPENQAATDPRVHGRTRPPVAETLGALTAMEIAAHEGGALHLCHMSLGRSVDLVRWYRDQGVDVSFESCPHYLTFREEDVQRQGGHLKINPPIRSEAEREALWHAVSSRAASVIASDHAPWPVDRKDNERMLSNASGAPGTQVMVPMVIGQAILRYGYGSELASVVDALTVGPASRYGLAHRKGSLSPGADADLAVLALDDSWSVRVEDQLSNAGWTPYDGRTPGVRVRATMSRGEIVWSMDRGLIGPPGRGDLICRA